MGKFKRISHGNKRRILEWSLCGILLVALPGCTLEKTYGSTATEGAVGGSLYTPASVSVGNTTLYWRQDVKKAAIDMIVQSQKVCYLTMYELGDQDVLDALAAAHKRGVDVRLILDATERHSLDTAVPFLKQAGIPYHLYHVKRGISHIKSLVTDDHGSLSKFDELMGGMNFGPHSWDNLDASIFVNGTNGDFDRLFLHDWAESAGEIQPEPVSSQFLIDKQIKPAMLQAVQSAQHSIAIEIFDLSDENLIQQLITAHQRGVKVQVLMEPTQKQNQQTAKRFKKAGIDVKFYKHIKNEILHAKILSIDNGAIVFVGSANFTHQGFYVNHEGDIELKHIPEFGKSIESCLQTEWQRN